MEEDDCPTNDFIDGKSNGNCWGDGHYRCQNCIHYRADFKEKGQDYIDWMHTLQGGLQFRNVNLLVI